MSNGNEAGGLRKEVVEAGKFFIILLLNLFELFLKLPRFTNS